MFAGLIVVGRGCAISEFQIPLNFQIDFRFVLDLTEYIAKICNHYEV